jgi:hypothetical protein
MRGPAQYGCVLFICFPAISYTGDAYTAFSLHLEEDAVVSATKAKAGYWWTELLYIRIARGYVAIDAVEYFEGCPTVDGSEF